MMNLPADSSLHQHPAFTGCSSLHSQLRQWRGGEETMGDLGGRVRRGEGQRGLGEEKGLYRTHICTHWRVHAHTHTLRPTHRQKEGGEEGKVI